MKGSGRYFFTLARKRPGLGRSSGWETETHHKPAPLSGEGKLRLLRNAAKPEF
jgi:hypothetical protein